MYICYPKYSVFLSSLFFLLSVILLSSNSTENKYLNKFYHFGWKLKCKVGKKRRAWRTIKAARWVVNLIADKHEEFKCFAVQMGVQKISFNRKWSEIICLSLQNRGYLVEFAYNLLPLNEYTESVSTSLCASDCHFGNSMERTRKNTTRFSSWSIRLSTFFVVHYIQRMWMFVFRFYGNSKNHRTFQHM